MTDSFHIDALIRLADGSTIAHSEAHEGGVPFTHAFACERAEEVAAELGGEVEDVESFIYSPPSVRWDLLDLY